MASLAGVTIHLEQDTGWIATPKYALLDPLDSTATTVHYISSPSNRRNVSGTIRSDEGNYDTIVTAARAHTSVSLVTDVDTATVYILTVSAQRIQNVGATTYYRFSAELMETT